MTQLKYAISSNFINDKELVYKKSQLQGSDRTLDGKTPDVYCDHFLMEKPHVRHVTIVGLFENFNPIIWPICLTTNQIIKAGIYL